MPVALERLKERATGLAAGFTTGQKAMLGLAALALLVASFGFTRWASAPSLAPLFTDLEAADAAAITEQLDAAGVGYELGDGGRTVLVPRAELYDLRLQMSAAGLPSGGTVGYALLDKQGITASEFRQRVDFQRALEGELVKTITAIEGVDAANVHLVIPKDDLFADDERHPSASVLVKTAPGKVMASNQVQAVVHLVSSSVEGLQPDQVTVADAKGNVLSAPGQQGVDAAGGDARAQQAQTFEQSLSRSVEELLVPVAGPGGAVVRVKADLDFDKRSTTTERFEQGEEGAVPVTESVTKETFTGAGTPVGGVLGPDAVPITGGSGDSNYAKEQTQRSNAVGRVTETIDAAPGSIKRMSVAVLLDEGKAKGLDVEEVESLVAAATNLDPERGDDIQVITTSFDRSSAEEAAQELAQAEAAERREGQYELARTALTLLAVAVVLLVAWRRSRRPRRQQVVLPYEAIALPPAADDDDEEDDEDDARQLTGRQAALPRPKPAPPERQRRLEVQEEIAELVDRQPEEVAQLLRGWLADRRS
ncbi:MAG TPA: flagellar basal-body MS-ring/collar protein FliF [Acidimicrobiales bacterium]|nr:flagellar basal-body MS-ring/collar protein FliF [Acidimicrobiales bacterium]